MNMNFDDNRTPGNSSFRTNGQPAGHYIDQLQSNDKVESSVIRDFSINASDVLCGRGKLPFNHAGNKRFRDLISSSVQRYNDGQSRLEKATVVNSIVEEIHASGGRFLRHDEAAGTWHPLGYPQCREKVGHAIRDAASSIEARKRRQRQQEVARKDVTSAIMAKSSQVLDPAGKSEASLSKQSMTGHMDNDGTFHHEAKALKSSIDSIVKHFAVNGSFVEAQQQAVEKPLMVDSPDKLGEPSSGVESENEYWRGARQEWKSKTPEPTSFDASGDSAEQEFLSYIDQVLGPLQPDVATNQKFREV